MKNRNLLAIFLPVLMFALVIPVSAQGRRWAPQAYGPVDLSEEQLVQIQEIQMAFQKEILPLTNDIMAGYMEMDNLYMQNAEQEKIQATGEALEMLELELDKMYDAHQQQVRELLTDEQKVAFDRWGGLGMGYSMGLGYGGRGYGMGYAAAWGQGRGMNRAGMWNRGMGYGTTYGRAPAGAYTQGYYGRGMAYSRGMGRGTAYGWGAGRGFARGMGRGMARAPFCRRWWIR